MEKLIQLLNGKINFVNFNDGRKLTLVTSRDTNDDFETGFYLDEPLEDGTYNRTKISNRLGYTLLYAL